MLQARTLSFGEVKYHPRTPGRREWLHTHPFWVLGALEGRGEARYLLSGSEVTLKEGRLLGFAPHAPHRLLEYQGAIGGYWVLHLDPERGATLPRGIRECSRLWEDFCDLARRLLSREAGEEELERFLAALGSEAERPIPDPGEVERIEAVGRYLEEHLEEPFELEALAEAFGMSPYTLIRRFKKRYGLPPRHYLINRRVHRAKELLAQGAQLSEAALECGFYDQSHLYGYFRGVFGVTPAAYLRALRSGQ